MCENTVPHSEKSSVKGQRIAPNHIKSNDRALSQALFTYVIKVMAERLSFASRVIGVFKR
jgi:hypothetical protein